MKKQPPSIFQKLKSLFGLLTFPSKYVYEMQLYPRPILKVYDKKKQF